MRKQAIIALLAAMLCSLAATPSSAGGRLAAHNGRVSATTESADQLVTRLTKADTRKELRRALLRIADALHLGVYSEKGEQVVPGTETGADSFYVYDFELAHTARRYASGKRVPLVELARELTALQPSSVVVTVGDLRKTIRDAIKASKVAPRQVESLGPLLVLESGLRQSPRVNPAKDKLRYLDPLQYLILLHALTTPANADTGEQRTVTPRAGVCMFNANLNATNTRFLILLTRIVTGYSVDNLPIGTHRPEIIEVELRVTAESRPKQGTGHYGPDEHGGKSRLRFAVQVVQTLPIPVIPQIECGALSGLTFPERGPVRGLAVDWNTSATDSGFPELYRHAARITPIESTAADGVAHVVVQLNDEENPGVGEVRTERGAIRPVVDLRSYYGSQVTIPVELPWSVSFHEDRTPSGYQGTVTTLVEHDNGTTQTFKSAVTFDRFQNDTRVFYGATDGTMEWAISGTLSGSNCQLDGKYTFNIYEGPYAPTATLSPSEDGFTFGPGEEYKISASKTDGEPPNSATESCPGGSRVLPKYGYDYVSWFTTTWDYDGIWKVLPDGRVSGGYEATIAPGGDFRLHIDTEWDLEPVYNSP